MGTKLKPVARRSARAAAPAAPPPAREAPRARPLEVALAALAAAAIGAWTFRGALALGFSQDDWLGLARAAGLVERLGPGWRWLSHQLFWDFAAGPLGSSPAAAHAVVLAAHAIASALLVVLLCRRLGAPAALLGGAFFASHFAHFTACFWLAANGDGFATLLALAATAAFLSRGAWRWTAVPLFVLALLAKESVLGLPLALAALAWLAPRRDRSRAPWRDPVTVTLALVAVAWALLLRPGGGSAALGGIAYSIAPSAVVPNLLTYAGWTLNAWLPTVRNVSERVNPAEFGWAAALLGTWLGACAVPALRARGAAAALAAYLALLLPVLPLGAHTYHYYLVAALPAVGLFAAALFDLGLARVPRVAAWPAALAFAALLAANGGALAHRLEHAPFLAEGLRADPVVDRARIASNTIAGLRAAALPRGSVVRLWSPQAQAMDARAGIPADREGYFEMNVRTALLDGLAVRVALPQVDSVAFVRAFDPGDSLAAWAVLRYDGEVRVSRAAEVARVLAGAARRP